MSFTKHTKVRDRMMKIVMISVMVFLGTHLKTMMDMMSLGTQQDGYSIERWNPDKRDFMPTEKEKQCAVFQTTKSHIDVFYSYLYLFQYTGCNVTGFFHDGVEDGGDDGFMDIAKPWLRGNVMAYPGAEESISVVGHPDAMVYTTFPEHHDDIFKADVMRKVGKKVFLIIHNPDLFITSLEPFKLAQLKKFDIKAVLLSPWAARHTRQLIENASKSQKSTRNAYEYFIQKENSVLWLPSLFPYGYLDKKSNSLIPFRSSAERDMNGICVQGSIQYQRRNFRFLLETLNAPYSKTILDKLRDKNEKIRIIGHYHDDVKSIIPSTIQDLVDFQVNLQFAEYYQVLSQCRAIMTLITEEQKKYYTEKMSSTINVALDVETPMVISDKEEAVYKEIHLSSKSCFTYEEGNGHSFAKAVDQAFDDSLVSSKRLAMADVKQQLVHFAEKTVAESLAEPING